jgi:hypothetical protein
MESCGGLATRLERRLATGAQLNKLPRIAASRKPCRGFSEGWSGASKRGRRIANPPQLTKLPHRNSSRRAKK